MASVLMSPLNEPINVMCKKRITASCIRDKICRRAAASRCIIEVVDNLFVTDYVPQSYIFHAVLHTGSE